MLIFIKLTVIFQLTKIQNFLAEYAVELASTDFDKIYSRNGAVQYEDYRVVYHPGTIHANSFRKLCINDYITPFRVTKNMNLTDIFTTYSIQEAWVDLYRSKVSGLLLDKTDFFLSDLFCNQVPNRKIFNVTRITIQANNTNTNPV